MATREELKQVFANGQMATGEKFANLIDSMKMVQLPVVDPQALGTSLSFIDSISQDADGKITVTKKTLDLANAHEINPFKGWWKTGDTLPTTGFDGAYLYFKDTTQTPAVTTIYQWNGTTYADTGTVVDTSNVQTFETGQAVNSMGITPNIVPNSYTNKIADARQINNLLNIENHISKNLLYLAEWDDTHYFGSSGGKESGGYYRCSLIPCEPDTDYFLSVNSGLIAGNTDVYTVLFGAGGVSDFISSVANCYRLTMSIHTTSDTRYIGVSLGDGADKPQLELGTSRTAYEEPFAPYFTIKIKSSVLPPMTIEELAGIITTEIVGEEEEKIADARQINNLLDFEEVRGKNLLYYPWEEKAYGATGGLASGGAYHHMDVPCEPSTNYCLSIKPAPGSNIGGGSVYVVLLGATKNVLSVVGNTGVRSMTITTTENTAYIGVSALKAAVELQLELGTSRTSYEQPFEPYTDIKIKATMLPPVNIPDGSITADKLAEGIILPTLPNQFGRIYASNAELAASTLLRTDFVECFKNISIVAHINSAFTEVQVGLGYHSIYGYSFKIDGTNIILVSGENDTVSATLPHGLTLGSETTFIIDKEVNAAAKITLMNDQGDLYQHDISNFGGQGRPFLRNNGSNAIDAEVSFVPKDINQKIWMFGDSYFSYNANNRWPYYLINNGYVSNLMASRGGDNATEALDSLTTLLGTGARPSYVLWFMGMNAGADTSSGPNATWLEKTQAMIALCSQYGITPILATIPTVPSQVHFYMNQWIRNSGYRYIDCAMAVEVSGSNYWKNWGEANAMLSSDEVHPTSYGAKALYSRVIADFPEITIED